MLEISTGYVTVLKGAQFYAHLIFLHLLPSNSANWTIQFIQIIKFNFSEEVAIHLRVCSTKFNARAYLPYSLIQKPFLK